MTIEDDQIRAIEQRLQNIEIKQQDILFAIQDANKHYANVEAVLTLISRDLAKFATRERYRL